MKKVFITFILCFLISCWNKELINIEWEELINIEWEELINIGWEELINIEWEIIKSVNKGTPTLDVNQISSEIIDLPEVENN